MKTRFFISVFMLFATSVVATGETINSQASTSGSGFKYEYIPNSALKISNVGIKDFNLNVEHKTFKYKNAKIDFRNSVRNGKKLSRSDIMEDQDKIHGVLKTTNTPNPVSIYDVALFYDETPLEVLGGKALSDKAATLAVLRRNSNLAYSSAPRPYDFDDDEDEEGEEEGEEEEEEEEEASYDEDEDEDEFDRGMSRQNKYDYSRSAASSSASDIFGNTDEYLFWAGMVFAAVAVGTGVVGFFQNETYTDANSAVTKAKEDVDKFKDEVMRGCSSTDNPDECIRVSINLVAEAAPGYETVCNSGNYQTTCDEGGYIWKKKQNIAANEQVRDSFNKGRIIFFSAAAVSAAISITLFAW